MKPWWLRLIDRYFVLINNNYETNPFHLYIFSNYFEQDPLFTIENVLLPTFQFVNGVRF
jgi:hypothetical protein